MKSKTIAVDFDGTAVSYAWPEVGNEIGAAEVLRDLQAAGHKIILLTMRSDKPLSDAVSWFSRNKITLYGINHNRDQASWSKSQKVYAHLYIDDQNLGAPLLRDETISEKPFIDWHVVRCLLEQEGYLEPRNII